MRITGHFIYSKTHVYKCTGLKWAYFLNPAESSKKNLIITCFFLSFEFLIHWNTEKVRHISYMLHEKYIYIQTCNTCPVIMLKHWNEWVQSHLLMSVYINRFNTFLCIYTDINYLPNVWWIDRKRKVFRKI